MIYIFFFLVGLWLITSIDRDNKRKAARRQRSHRAAAASAGLLGGALLSDEHDSDWDMNVDPSLPDDDYGVFSQSYFDPYLDPWGHGPND